MALSHPAMRGTYRLFHIIDPAACAIAGPQAPGDLELAPRAFGTGKRREALHYSSIHRTAVPLRRSAKPAQDVVESQTPSTNSQRTAIRPSDQTTDRKVA